MRQWLSVLVPGTLLVAGASGLSAQAPPDDRAAGARAGAMLGSSFDAGGTTVGVIFGARLDQAAIQEKHTTGEAKEDRLNDKLDRLLEQLGKLERRIDSLERVLAAPAQPKTAPPQQLGRLRHFLGSLFRGRLLERYSCFPGEPDVRMESLLVDPEELRKIKEDWKRFWFVDQPAHMTFERVPGGIE